MVGLDKDSKEYQRLRMLKGGMRAMNNDAAVSDISTLSLWEYPLEIISAGTYTKIKLGIKATAAVAAIVKFGDEIGSTFKAFNRSNYRHNLKVFTGKSGFLKDAHHIFPQTKEFGNFFKNANINIHHPEHMAWWSIRSHRRNANQYNNAWRSFIGGNPNANRNQILNFGADLMKKYGF